MEKDLKYRIMLFKLEGHKTWRMTTASSMTPGMKVTDIRIIEIDRITGEIKEVKK